MYAIFDVNNNYVGANENPHPTLKSLIIEKDIDWKIRVKRGCDIIKKNTLVSGDVVVNRKKGLVAVGGEEIDISPQDMQSNDVIIREYEKERIKTNSSNQFLLKTDNELRDEYKEKIKDYAKNNMPMKCMVEGITDNILQKLDQKLNGMQGLEETRDFYMKILTKINGNISEL